MTTTSENLDEPTIKAGLNPESIVPRIEAREPVLGIKRPYKVVTANASWGAEESAKYFKTGEKALRYFERASVKAERRRAERAWRVVKY